MRSISANFEIILAKQREIDYHFINIIRKPASPDDISYTEMKLGLNFNTELRELYSFADGTDIDDKTPSGLTGLIPIHNFLSLKNAVVYYDQSVDFEMSFKNWNNDDPLGKKLFPFLEDGAGNCYWVDLNESTINYGKIFWTNTFGASPDYTYSSLSNLFQVIADCYQNGIIFKDTDGYLNCDFNEFHNKSKYLNPEIKYWDN